ncbi:GIY-YIG nuclease family protein [Gracilibacillus sp. YIM 98692]|uniref:GIY-YIG nuclease family protein n=1 Tax=Gracilibacillus sp. YIM 98692 TaxID=2663532 RepID=UPI0013D44012|nr:GIY-YIG nuclease family protein [Gracilibacillus sp. YIM 98692]
MEENNQHYVYMLECKDHTLYTGYTTNINHRLALHRKGKGAKYMRGRAPFKLVYQTACSSKSEALSLEAKIKKLTKEQKLSFIKENRKERYVIDEDTK